MHISGFFGRLNAVKVQVKQLSKYIEMRNWTNTLFLKNHNLYFYCTEILLICRWHNNLEHRVLLRYDLQVEATGIRTARIDDDFEECCWRVLQEIHSALSRSRLQVCSCRIAKLLFPYLLSITFFFFLSQD